VALLVETSFDAGRVAVPVHVAIINVQARRDIARRQATNHSGESRQGIHKFFITDDNFARNKNGNRSSPDDRDAGATRLSFSS
jgi:hypothetical protein